MSSASPSRVAIVGGSFSGNKGAASMLQAVIDELPHHAGSCRFAVLSPYPVQDAREQGPGPLVIVPWRPQDMILAALLLPLLAVGRRFGARRLVASVLPGTRAIASADIVVDVSGICFVDGRPLTVLVYNVLQVLIPRALGVSIVKAAQATGPFQTQPNRWLARQCLSRVDRLFSRGSATADHLDELGVTHERADDLAFLLDPPAASHDEARRLLAGVDGDFIAVVPSIVVKQYCDDSGIDYLAALSRLIDSLTETLDTQVVIVPHARRDGKSASRMDDLPIARELAGLVARKDRSHLIEELVDPHALRIILSSARVVVSGRFHAMISSLATATPVVVTGWSHKYREVLEEFGLAGCAVPYAELDGTALHDAVVAAWHDHRSIAAQIEHALPAVRERSAKNMVGAAELLSTGG